MYYDELYHHGIRGQRWGVRRFQNKDGSLTKLGQKRVEREQKKADKAAQKSEKKSGLFVKKKVSENTEGPANENDLKAQFRELTGDKPKSAGRGRISELAGLAGIAGVAGGIAALHKVNSEEVKKPAAFEGKKPERPTKPDDVLTNEESRKKWLTERSVYEKDLKDYNADKAEANDLKQKYKEKLNARMDLTKSALDATKGASSGIVNMMKQSNERKAQEKANSLDLSHLSEKQLRDYVNRYNAEQSFRKVAAEQYNSGRSKTMDIIETAGSLAGVGSSVLGFASAYKKFVDG